MNVLKCDECSKRFKTKKTLKRHIKSIHEKETFRCNLCDHVAYRVHHLTQHKESVDEKRGTGFAKHVRIPVIESVILSFICEFTLERNRFNATNVLLNFPTKAACEHIQITVHHNHFNFNTHLKIHLNNCMLSFYFAVKKNKIKDIKKCFLNYTFSHLIHI